ncbi:50S ribosomal protein L18 [Candidatus Saccharibacteria bacterium]|nr:50S ribosomal protein L18 [Candidatus Saccharibacteria bacterium]
METKELRHKRANALRRLVRTRARLRGSAEVPRLSVHISLQHVSAQIINDVDGKTLIGLTTAKKTALKGKNLTEKATWAGQQIAELALKSKVTKVVFDRGAKRYHGRMAAFATAARDKGLEF